MDREGDGVLGEVGNIPEPVGPVVGAAVEGVVSVVGLGMVGLVADGVLRVTNAVDVPTWDGIVDGMAWVLR